jgi:hypothetical protein
MPVAPWQLTPDDLAVIFEDAYVDSLGTAQYLRQDLTLTQNKEAWLAVAAKALEMLPQPKPPSQPCLS